MGSPNEFDHYPYLVSLNLDEFMIGKPMNLNLDHHEPLIKNVIISSQESKMMQNPSSSYSSSSSSSSSSSPPIIIHENPNTKLAMIDTAKDQMKNPVFPPAEMSSSAELFTLENYVMRSGLRDIEEDFLQNPASLMTKIDQEYMNWQQQEVVDHSMQLVQTVVGSNFQGFNQNKVMDLGNLDKMSVATTQVVEKSADSHFGTEKNHGFSDERMAKSVERRQKRMIKNRESAARSRARKQAYIDQLQHDVSQLQTSNKLLRKRKEANNILKSSSISAPRYQLRRTSSSHI